MSEIKRENLFKEEKSKIPEREIRRKNQRFIIYDKSSFK
jgi:hypothetical protein